MHNVGGCGSPDSTIWIAGAKSQASITSVKSDGTFGLTNSISSEQLAAQCSSHQFTSYMYVSTNFPDNVFVLNASNVQQTFHRIAMQNTSSTSSGGCGHSVPQLSSGNLYVSNSDSDLVNTQHIQVYNPISTTYLFGFGGNGCGDSGSNYLCQTFNGIGFVPR